VFTTRHGEPLDGPRLNRQTKKLLRQTWSGGLADCKHLQVIDQRCADCQAEHLPVLRFHSLRHSCASFLLAQSVPARVVMEVSWTLGYSADAEHLLTREPGTPRSRGSADEAVLWSGANA
jgi:hypothetical protein